MKKVGLIDESLVPVDPAAVLCPQSHCSSQYDQVGHRPWLLSLCRYEISSGSSLQHLETSIDNDDDRIFVWIPTLVASDPIGLIYARYLESKSIYRGRVMLYVTSY